MNNLPNESIYFSCPHCRTRLKCPAAQAGRAVKCPKCGKQFRVRGPSGQQPANTFADPPARPPQRPATPSIGAVPAPRPLVRGHDNRRSPSSVGGTRQQLFVVGTLAMFALCFITILAGAFFASAQASPSDSMRDVQAAKLLGYGIFSAVLVGMILLYFVPSVVGFVREHQNAMPIFILNLFFGWSLLGWVICLAWSFSSDVRETRQYVRQVTVKG